MRNDQAETPVHISEIHVRCIGECPICYVAAATSFEDLRERMDTAQEWVADQLEIQQQILMSKLEGNTISR